MSIFARSPFIVEISETGQEGSKVELFLWNGTGAAPANPSYTLSKLIPATNNVNTYYNISPYIREFISFDTRFEIYNTYPAATNEQWCNVIYKRYKTTEGLKEFVADPTVASQEPQYELIGALKLIEEALNKVNQPQPQPAPFYPISPNLNPPYIPSIGVPNTSPDWTYRPEYQPYYTVTCTTNTTQQK